MEDVTPNCSLCLWIIKKKRIRLTGPAPICSAQGFVFSSSAYNTPECRDLFKEKKEQE